ncbi:hypothetical protein N7527_001281 [Penicillium freii]|nr:hypothetical protein N7527_001281 [Penicillium freii]
MGMAEMALLYHFSTSTCYTVSPNPDSASQLLVAIRIPRYYRSFRAISSLYKARIPRLLRLLSRASP